MDLPDLYGNAHLVVAAVRVLAHRQEAPPSVEAVCDSLGLSHEIGYHICRKLNELGIVDLVEGAFGTKLFVLDHLKIETIARDQKASRLEDELKRFQDTRKQLSQKIESFQAKQKEKQKKLFESLGKKLKSEDDSA